ncbi:MAG TPA: GFA family protein [Kofleriaceae bacterium]|nr:GFA family protein [Kofleriaceae bacterium]
MRVTGACHCGAIRYEADIDPATAGICHCRDCQVLSGTAFRVYVRAAPGTFKILSGCPRVYTKTAETGAKREQAFCETCGSPIYATAPGPEPRVYSIRAGTLDQRDQLDANIQIWARSRLPLLDRLDAIPKLETQQ